MILFNLTLFFPSYTVCVRRLQGFCCVQYQVCETGGFSLDGHSTVADTSDTGITCTTDYIDIPGTYIFFNLFVRH